jgi:DNA repair exonuclease SbcCD ATPase subunit
MANNTKEYKIVINGITESVDAVKSLNSQLDKLEQRMKTLSSAKVSTGGSSSKGSASVLSEEEAVQREINKLKQQGAQLDAKIAATQNEIFKRVDATKELYKETLADQKAIAAQERLTADAYSNTMQGMKAQLADIKAVINVTDLGDSTKIEEMTKKANDLTNKLKEMEQAYGQYGRNVGNYANGVAEGLQKVRVTVGDTVREFGSAKEASRTLNNELKTMAANGQQDTEAFKQLRQTVMELESNINDAKKPMDNLMDSMEGVMAVANAGQGIRALFGVDDTEIQKSIKNLVALQNVLKGLETINKQIQTREGVGKWIAPFTTQIDAATAKLLKFNTALLGTSKAAKVASVGIKAFSTALKAAVSMGILVAVDLLVEGLMNLVESFKKVDHAAEDAKEAEEAVAKAYGEGMSKLTQYKSKLDAFNGSKKEEKKLVDELNNELGDTLGTYKSVAEWQDVLKKKGEAYIETIKLQAQAQAILNAITAAYGRIQQIGFSKANGEYDTLINKSLNLIGLGKDYMEDLNETNGYIDTLTKNLDVVYKKIEQNNKKNKLGSYAPQIEKNTEKSKKAIEDSQKTLNQLEIRRMREGLNKKLRQLDEEERQTINKLKENGRKSGIEIQKVQRAYADLRQREINEYLRNLEETIKKTARDIKNIKFDINLKDIEIEVDNLKNKFEELDNSPINKTLISRIDLKQIFGNSTQEGRILANEYNEKKLEAEATGVFDEFYDFLQGYLETKNEEVKQEFNELFENIGEEQAYSQLSAFFEDQYSDALSAVRTYGQLILDLDEEMTKDSEDVLSLSFAERLLTAEKYYSETIQQLTENIKKQRELNEKAIKERFEQDEEAERERYTKQYQELDRQRQETEDAIANFKVRTTEEQKAYEDLKKKLDTINKQMEDALELHGEKMGQINEKKNAEIKKNEIDTYNDISSIQEKYFNAQLSSYRDMQSKLNDEISRNPITYKGGWGVVDISATKHNYSEIIEASRKAIDSIRNDKRKLDELYDKGFITPEAYNSTLIQLNDLEKDIKNGMAETVEKNKMLIADFLQSMQQYIQASMESFNTIMNAVWDAQDVQFEKEQEYLDKLNDELDKKLDEQQEIVEKHKDVIDSIEEELAQSRGSRRQHLIDQLNAEMEAQKEAQRQEKQIQKEKEAAEKRQDELEKKRKKAQYQRDMAQAIVNGAMAVTMAAVNNWPIPAVPMMALAAATTAAQIAIMSSNKPYAKGGVLEGGVAQGPRHSQGGIPVLGGRASIEGGEMIVNRVSTAKNVDVLEYINSKHKKLNLDDFIDFYSSGKVKNSVKSMSPRIKFAEGGVIPSLSSDIDINDRLLESFEKYAEKPQVVQVVDIINRTNDVKKVQVLAGLSNG